MDNCIFCGLSTSQKFYLKDEGDDNKSSSSWSLACLTSICALFGIQPSDPLHRKLMHSPICTACRQLISDTDFSLRLLDKCLSQVENYQAELLAKVETNLVRITENRKEELHVDNQELVICVAEKFRKASVAIHAGLEGFKILLNLPSLKENKWAKVKFTKFEEDVETGTNASVRQDQELELGEVKIEADSSDEDWNMVEDGQENDQMKEGDEDKYFGKDDESELDDAKKYGKSSFPCPLCPVKCSSTRGLAIHTGRIHKKETRLDLDNNSDSEEEEVSRVSDGDDYNPSSPNYLRHAKKIKQSTTKEHTITCPVCNVKCASTPHGLAIHNTKMHEKTSLPIEDPTLTHPCNLCSLKFISTEELVAHEEAHRGTEAPFTCTLCGMTTPNSTQLRKHVARAHTRKESHNLCDICGLSLLTPKSLKDHRKMHSNSSLFPCTICSHNFPSKAALEIHSHKHAETKGFICEICGKSYRYRKGLNGHRESIHDQDSTVKCAICNKAFPHRKFLLLHERIHSSLTPYSCKHSSCGRQFRTHSNKWQHENFHCSSRIDKGKVSAFQRRKNEKKK